MPLQGQGAFGIITGGVGRASRRAMLVKVSARHQALRSSASQLRSRAAVRLMLSGDEVAVPHCVRLESAGDDEVGFRYLSRFIFDAKGLNPHAYKLIYKVLLRIRESSPCFSLH